MQIAYLQDRIAKGLAPLHAASVRPTTRTGRLRPMTRWLPQTATIRLPAAFNPEGSSFSQPAGYSHATWFGLFDNAYTHPGDYLKGPGGTFFIAAQQSLLPILCVLTSRTLTISRPAAPTAAGVNTYGGITLSSATPLLTGWPASVLSAGSGGQGTCRAMPSCRPGSFFCRPHRSCCVRPT